MEEEKKDNKKAGMRRALNVRDILNKKYDVFPFEGKWKDAFDTPEVRGCWFVWGNSGNGKTSFVMQLCKELCKYDRVAFNSLEEGTSLTVQNNLRRFGMAEVSRHLAFIKEDIPTLKIRLRRHKSFNIVIIDSFQYTQMTYRDYIQLKEEFPVLRDGSGRCRQPAACHHRWRLGQPPASCRPPSVRLLLRCRCDIEQPFDGACLRRGVPPS